MFLGSKQIRLTKSKNICNFAPKLKIHSRTYKKVKEKFEKELQNMKENGIDESIFNRIKKKILLIQNA